MQSTALSVAEETEQQDPETIHLTRQHSLKKNKNKEQKKSPEHNTLTPTSFSFSILILPLTSLNLWGTWYNTLALKTITIHL